MPKTELPVMPRGLDLYSSYGAGVLAGHIERYWKARGFAGIVTERFEIALDTWGIRSNIVAGFPPRRAVRGGGVALLCQKEPVRGGLAYD